MQKKMPKNILAIPYPAPEFYLFQLLRKTGIFGAWAIIIKLRNQQHFSLNLYFIIVSPGNKNSKNTV